VRAIAQTLSQFTGLTSTRIDEKWNGKLYHWRNYEMTNSFRKGDLIYTEKWDTYAVFLGKGEWTGWIHVYLPDTNERKQVHDYVWELV